MDSDRPAADTAAWWEQTAQEDFEASVPKALEYGGGGEGSADLRIMAFMLSELKIPAGTPLAVGQEAGCWLYAGGKLARMISNYNRGEPGKADSWHDLTVYSMMARRIQAVGRWP